MATKATAKMATDKKSATSKKPSKSTNSKKMMHLYKERNPEYHQITGKFMFLYFLFAVTTLIFAAVSVWLFFFSSELLEKYKAIDACDRTKGCRIVVDSGAESEE
jgi:hypothetical protein